jgi:hypothetical protein
MAGGTMQIEYLEEVRKYGTTFGQIKRHSSDYKTEYRKPLVKKYAWAIPNEKALQTIATYEPIIEIGAGTGYWAYLLQQMGVDLIPYDIAPPKKWDNRWFGSDYQWTTIKRKGPQAVRTHPHRTLMLCWPPYDGHMAYEALSLTKATHVIYIGEGWGGCCADDTFFEYLKEHFDLKEEISIPQWDCISDSLAVYKRK